MFNNELRPIHLIIIALVALILFGSKRLPDAARSIGKSLRIIKSEVTQENTEHNKDIKN